MVTKMNTEQKKELLADVRKALHALGRIEDEPHDLSKLHTFGAANVKTLRDSSLTAMCGLSLLDAILNAEIGTDNL